MHADASFGRLRVLIAEDEVLIAEELRERLSRLGFAVISLVDSAEDAIAATLREHPDLVLMDIRLKGGSDGIKAAEEIHRQVDTPIVYLTACSDPLTVDRAKRTDYDGFLLKPFHRSELQSTIEVALQRRAMRASRREQ